MESFSVCAAPLVLILANYTTIIVHFDIICNLFDEFVELSILNFPKQKQMETSNWSSICSGVA
jgi:hypothetical protein